MSIKGNVMAGSFEYDGPVIIQGNITSPNHDNLTKITVTGEILHSNPHKHKYKIENGATITVGNVKAGNIFGRKYQVQDPEGRVHY